MHNDIKFGVVFSRGCATIVEMRCTRVFSHSWELRIGECRYRIDAPTALAGEVWYSHAVFDSEGEARAEAIRCIMITMTDEAKKLNAKLDEMMFLKRVASITTSKLEN